MKSLSITLTAIIFSIIAISPIQAQKATFETNSGMTIGFGAGSSWQKADIANSRGGGFDFQLGSHLWKKENALLSADWKFRFLAGENMALDHRINSFLAYNNIRYSFFNYDVELGLTLNKLRERTRIVLSVFAGAGITHGLTATNLLDSDGNDYDYSVIDPTAERNKIYHDLLDLTDGSYETKLTNHGALLPTAGIFIGYQFTRSFSLGLEYKTNLYLSEKNGFSGINIDNIVATGSRKDRNIYTSLGFRWILGERAGRAGTRITYPAVTNPAPIRNQVSDQPPVYTPPPVIRIEPPVAEIIMPAGETYSTSSGNLELTARVLNVKGKQNVSVLINNKPVAFDYSPVYNNVKSFVPLNEGRNILTVTANNETGSARDELVIISKKSVQAALPSVKFTSPQVPVTVDRNSFQISAQTRNVKNWQDVTLTVNGIGVSNFNFSDQGIVTTNIGLKEGVNRVALAVRNETGTASDEASITYTKTPKMSPPVVTILSPTSSPYSTYEPDIEISVKITGVKSKEGISLVINNLNKSDFSFDQNTLILTASVSLRDGSNTVVISSANEAGKDSKTVTIAKEILPCPKPTLNAGIDAVTGTDITHQLRGTASSLKSRSDLTVIVNNKPFDSFTFNSTTGEFAAGFKFLPGTNTITVTARNECGSDTRYFTASVDQPCYAPKVTLTLTPSSREGITHELKGTVINIKNKNDITVTVNDQPFEGFSFVPNTTELTSAFKLDPGTYIVKVNARNECGSDSKAASATVEQPCIAPRIAMTLSASSREGFTHELKGTVSNIKNKNDITVTVNDQPFEGFSFVPNTTELTAALKLDPGTYTIKVTAKNECGYDAKTSSVIIEKPCEIPSLSITVTEITNGEINHRLIGEVKNINDRNGISVTLNNAPVEGFRFNGSTGELSADFNLEPGTYNLLVTLRNECGSASKNTQVTVEKPCIKPQVNFTINSVNIDDATHELKGAVTGVKDKNEIVLTVNGKPFEDFSFAETTGEIKASFSFEPGTYSVKAVAKNECGSGEKTTALTVEPKPCGVRILPGNSDWEFCLITPSGSFTRDTLTSKNFSYTGPASALFFKPIGGGGDAKVDGKSYKLSPGQYYLFTGNLVVTVSTKNPGAMGMWSVCIVASKLPETGTGNNRPKSPCEGQKDDRDKK